MEKIRVFQDGATFYCRDDVIGNPIDMFTYHTKVGDFDLAEAQKARAWFFDEVVPEEYPDVEIIWEGP